MSTTALQQSPVKALTSRLGELKEEADPWTCPKCSWPSNDCAEGAEHITECSQFPANPKETT